VFSERKRKGKKKRDLTYEKLGRFDGDLEVGNFCPLDSRQGDEDCTSSRKTKFTIKSHRIRLSSRVK
jgi:hypothetical protein